MFGLNRLIKLPFLILLAVLLGISSFVTIYSYNLSSVITQKEIFYEQYEPTVVDGVYNWLENGGELNLDSFDNPISDAVNTANELLGIDILENLGLDLSFSLDQVGLDDQLLDRLPQAYSEAEDFYKKPLIATVLMIGLILVISSKLHRGIFYVGLGLVLGGIFYFNTSLLSQILPFVLRILVPGIVLEIYEIIASQELGENLFNIVHTQVLDKSKYAGYLSMLLGGISIFLSQIKLKTSE